ncbi:MAG: hypothetical protein ACREAB_19025, partial [Blastocatellia bacterium]
AAWLAQTCGAEAELRAEVEKLLAHHREDGEYLDRPALDMAAALLSQKQQTTLLSQKISHFQNFVVIPPAEAGGLFISNLPRMLLLSKSHQRQLVDCSSPAFGAGSSRPLQGQELGPRIEALRLRMEAGLEQSTSFRWWDSGDALGSWLTGF